jgi:UDP-N-acetylmuramoyl-L-alanyl-D-glutamate--2,6-diaminopimelate ligase
VPNQLGVLCVVDYAHTPDALERALGALRPITRARLIVVFGCGGDRDASKRPLMGAAAARLADLAIVTSDNPRSEDPEHIVAMIVTGARRTAARELDGAAVAAGDGGFFVAVERRMAIRRAVAIARAGDTVLIAGKGHEDYQIVGTTRIHFDDREEAAAAFAARGQP